MSKQEEVIKLEYPTIPPVESLNQVRIIPAKDMVKMQKYKTYHAKTMEANSDRKIIMNKIMKANNAGMTEIRLKKAELPKPVKYELRKQGYQVDKIASGCMGKSMRIIKWGVDFADEVLEDLQDMPQFN